jgi:hypothetical protein
MTLGKLCRRWALALLLTAPIAQAGDSCQALFGYELGQKYELSAGTESRLNGIVVADSAELLEGLDELLLTVTPKSKTIICIRGTTRTDRLELLNELQSNYRTQLKEQCGEWSYYGDGTDLTFLVHNPYWLLIKISRTRDNGVFELSVSLEFASDSLEKQTYESLRISEASEIIADHLEGSR